MVVITVDGAYVAYDATSDVEIVLIVDGVDAAWKERVFSPSVVYQGAWQHSTYRGAWQQQGQEFTKSFTESMSLGDVAVLGTGKGLAESMSLADVIAMTMGWSRSFVDILTLSDIKTLGFSTAFADAFGLADSVVLVSGVEMALTDALSVSDGIVLDFGLSKMDQLSMGDSLSLKFDFVMNLTDSFGIADAYAAGVALVKSDTIVISDVYESLLTIQKTFSDSLSLGDGISFLISKSLAESLGLGDSVAFIIGKELSDSFNISDVHVVSASKSLSDLISFADALYKSLTIGEQIVGLKKIAETLVNAPTETIPFAPYIAIGASDAGGEEADETALWDELHRKLGGVSVRANTYFVRATFGQDEPTADDLVIKEVGIFDAASGGRMGQRWVLANPVDKDNIDEIVVECALTILHSAMPEVLDPDSAPVPGKALDESFGFSDSISFQMQKELSFGEVVGLSDDVNLQLVPGDLPSHFYFYDVAFKSASAYVFATVACYDTSEYGIVAIDVSDPSNPAVVGWLVIDPAVYGFVRHCQVLETEYIDDKFLIVSVSEYSGVSGGLLSIKITNPASMSIVDKYDMGDPALYNTSVRCFDLKTVSDISYAYIVATDAQFGLVRVRIGSAGDFGVLIIRRYTGENILDVAVDKCVVIIKENRLWWLSRNLTELAQLYNPSNFDIARGLEGGPAACNWTWSKPTGFSDLTHKLTHVCTDEYKAYVSVRSLSGPGSTLWAVDSNGRVLGIGPISAGTTSDDTAALFFNDGVIVSASVSVGRWYSCDPVFTIDGCHTSYYLGTNCPACDPKDMLYPKARVFEDHDVLGTEGGFVPELIHPYPLVPHLFVAGADEGLWVWDMTDMWSPVFVSQSLGQAGE